MVSLAKRASLVRLVPPGVRVYEVEAGDELAPLHPAEHEWLAGSSPGRYWSFQAGRHCARHCLADVGLDVDGPLLPDLDAAVAWPEGIVGSILHLGDYAAAVVGPGNRIDGLGIAADRTTRMAQGLLQMVTSARERADIEHREAHAPAIAWDRVLYCAKRAVVKAHHPLLGELVHPGDVLVKLRDNGSFLGAIASGDADAQPEMALGRFSIDDDRVVAIAALGLGRRD